MYITSYLRGVLMLNLKESLIFFGYDSIKMSVMYSLRQKTSVKGNKLWLLHGIFNNVSF